MGFLDSIKSMLSAGTETLEEEVSRREAELNATPEQRMEMLQDEIEGNDDAFDQIQSKIDNKGAKALATAELDEQELQNREADRAEDNEGEEDPSITDAKLVDEPASEDS